MSALDIISRVVRDLRKKLQLKRYGLVVCYFRGDTLLGVFTPPETSDEYPWIDINGDFDLLLSKKPLEAEADLVYMVAHEMRHFWQWANGWNILSDEAEDDADKYAYSYVEKWMLREHGIMFDSRDIPYIALELGDILEENSDLVRGDKVELRWGPGT